MSAIPSVSVVVPTLDEARALPGLLRRLAWLPLREVIVVDGGSRDGTAGIAAAAGARVVRTGTAGRGPQLARGAAEARGEVVWFLHADARPPLDAVARIREALAGDDVVGGAFLLHTVPGGGPWSLGPLLRVADLRSRWTGLPYGDQGIFCRREALDAVGGVPAQPLFEDLELSRRLRARGRLARVPQEIEVSGRRFEARPLASFVAMHALPVLYRLGVPPARLARWYAPVR
ncbi:MAG: TIGR04283 family arsenosugar biosynthesis glycosyltransferase [Alphaproteobacteria bacterium]|nr:TIGR04283 family arsenosugar biosynthesis glycosyltransferase [Alphaproteobacteria bacterium]